MKITSQTTVGEIKTASIFENYGHLLFPVDLHFSASETLAQIMSSSHYLWYSNLKIETSLEVMDYLSKMREQGQQIFYSIYNQEEQKADPSRANTGLFFFRGKPNEKFAVVSAGGGFYYVAALHDSLPHALAISRAGYNAFALIYRPDHAYEDLGKALDYIYEHAEGLQVSRENYSLWGGSAGARMAITLGNLQGLRRFTNSKITQAGLVVSQYTGYSQLSHFDAPTYANCGTSDGIANWRTMKMRIDGLNRLGIKSKFKAYSGLRHGFGIGKDTPAKDWIKDALAFWEQQSN